MRRGTNTLLAWLAALLWAGFIWGLGTDGFSMSSTSRFLGPLIDWLAADWSAADRQAALTAIRKGAHVGEYAIFALLAGRAVAMAFAVRMRFVAAGALAAVIALATADELRQALSHMRTGSAYDVALDALGGIVALGLLFALRRWLGRPLFDSRPRSQAGARP